MKCDELKVYVPQDGLYGLVPEEGGEPVEEETCYLKSEVDAVIAELKQKLQDQCISCPVKKQEADVVAELKRDLEDAKATAYAESVDAGMENRRLKRTLWLARAKRAEARKNYWYVRSIHEGDKYLWSIDGSAVKYIGCIKRTNFDWLKTWSEVQIKCQSKVEEYK